MIFIGPLAGPAGGCRLCVAARSRPQCRAGDFARRLGSAASQGFRDDASTATRRRRFGAQSTKCRLLARRSSPTEAGQGPAGLCRISPPPTGNAPLRLRLAAHPPSGLRCPHRTARAEARLCSATVKPAPSRFLRRRRRSTPQPLAGEASQTASAHKKAPGRRFAAPRCKKWEKEKGVNRWCNTAPGRATACGTGRSRRPPARRGCRSGRWRPGQTRRSRRRTCSWTAGG